MLCPKCGFISFDHLSACGKCRNDLSVVAMNLHGTAVDVECRLFLGSTLKEGSSPHDEQPEEAAEAAVAVDFPFEEEESSLAADEMDVRDQDDAEQKEAIGEVSVEEEPPALEFELDEIVLVDSSDVDSSAADEKAVAESGQSEETEVTLLDFGDEGAGGEEAAAMTAAEAEVDGEVLEIDASSLTLDSFEEEVAQPISSEIKVEEESPGQLTVDLDAIDLSDLVHGQSGTSPTRDEEAASAVEEGGLDFEDTMDLSLFVGESHDVPPVDADEQLVMDKGPEPIDLSLVDEALVDLAVDSSRQEQTLSEEEGHSDILELSMEDSSK